MNIIAGANLLLCLFFLYLAMTGWKQRQYHFTITNAIGCAVVIGIEVADRFVPIGRLDLFLCAAAVSGVLLADGFWAWRGDISLWPTTDAGDKRRRSVPFTGSNILVITDPARLEQELELYPGLQQDERAFVLRLHEKGALAFSRKNYQRARQEFESAMEWAPHASCYANLGASLLAQNEYGAALKKCDAATQLDPKSYEAWINRGIALDGLEKHAAAIESFEHASTLQPNRIEPYLLKVQTLRRLNQWQPAIDACEKALSLDDGNPEALYLKGLCLYRAMRLDESRACFESIVEQSPDYAPAHFSLGNVLLKMDRFEDAAKSYSTALRFEPQYVEALNNRGIALGKMGRLQEARRNYQSALRLNPGYHEALLNLAVAYDVSNEKPKAVENYRKFLQVAPAQMKEKAAIVSRRVDELVAMAENPAADASFHPAELSAHT